MCIPTLLSQKGFYLEISPKYLPSLIKAPNPATLTGNFKYKNEKISNDHK